MNDEKNNAKKYLTIEMFEKFKNNEFFHLKVEVRVALIIACAILSVLLALK